ncbi:MAG: hypothetical protein BMS9Abin37_1039 [Acidobacteriota bacterium]|nr:MAG: hypothetical protein BMS9Abin37_1039 [Acidobacteriota bacterium]
MYGPVRTVVLGGGAARLPPIPIGGRRLISRGYADVLTEDVVLERHRLEFDHDEAYGLGGDRSAANVRLLCTVHNLYMAEKVYGKEKMAQYRRPADAVREPAPSFELRPDGAQHPFQHRAAGLR